MASRRHSLKDRVPVRLLVLLPLALLVLSACNGKGGPGY